MVKISSFNRKIQLDFDAANNNILSSMPINVKISKDANTTKFLDPTTSLLNYGTGTGTGTIIVIDGIKFTDGFTQPNTVQFYKDLLDTIDNMILLDYLRDNVMPQDTIPTEYSVVKTNDIGLDVALIYYTIVYPMDTEVDPTKLAAIQTELQMKLGL
jgi:hypothetical protein